MSRLHELVILLNERCNLRCDYCRFCAPEPPGKTIDAGLVSRALVLFFEGARSTPHQPRTICFNADGEALLDRSLLVSSLQQAAQLRDAHGADVTIAVVTNATRVDLAFARKLAELGVAATVSLDGDRSCHDAHRKDPRGQGSHAEVLRGLTWLHRAGVPTSLRGVHTPTSLAHLRDSYNELRGHAPPRPVKLRPVRLAGPPWFDPGWARAYAKTYCTMVRRLVRDGAPWQTLPDHARHVAAWLMEGRSRRRYCGAGHDMLWLTPGGALVPCGLLSRGQDSLAHMGDVHDLRQLEAALDHPLSRSLKDNAPALREPCRGCRWLPACRGGCPVEAMDEAFQPVAPPLCVLYRRLGTLLEAEL